jgi:hypothetical protein
MIIHPAIQLLTCTRPLGAHEFAIGRDKDGLHSHLWEEEEEEGMRGGDENDKLFCKENDQGTTKYVGESSKKGTDFQMNINVV